jgi:hypothetical protein
MTDITFMGIPIVFDESLPTDTFYIVSNSLDAKRLLVLDRLLTGIASQAYHRPRSTPARQHGQQEK